MSIPTYTPGYPLDNSTLGQTKSTIRDNLDGTFLTLAVDHVNNNGQPSPNPAGYHTVIHEVTQTNVSTVSGVNQIFSGIPGTLVVNGSPTAAVPPSGGDTQLYSLTGQGGLAQLTGYHAVNNGYAWMGGMLVQWGRFLTGSGTNLPGSGSVTFPVAFPSLCLNVQLTFLGNSTSGQSIQVTTSGTPPVNPVISTTAFSWKFTGGSSNSYSGFFWFAIGR